MNDTLLLLVGCAAFGLMLIGIAFTVVEFRAVGKRDRQRRTEEFDPPQRDQR